VYLSAWTNYRVESPQQNKEISSYLPKQFFRYSATKFLTQCCSFLFVEPTGFSCNRKWRDRQTLHQRIFDAGPSIHNRPGIF